MAMGSTEAYRNQTEPTYVREGVAEQKDGTPAKTEQPAAD